MEGLNNIYTTIGASNHSLLNREENDYYATEPRAIDKLLSAYQIKHNVIWECACGEGNLSKRLEERGYKVFSSDLINRGYGEVKDFLKESSTPSQCILTNPPYKLATDFIKHALELVDNGGEVIMFLKTTFLEGKNHYNKIFKDNPPKYFLQSIDRINCARNNEFEKYKSSAISYGWFIWEKGYNDNTIIKWC